MKPLYISRSVIVGLFILLGMIIFTSAVFTIGNQQKTFEKTITIKAIFDDVNGLQPGNNVWLSGVKIGTVKKMNFLGIAEVEVTMNIERQALSHIKKDAKAKIGTDGFIGNKIIIIFGGTGETASVSGNDYLKTEKSIGTDDMMAKLRQSNDNIAAITEDLRTISNKIKEGKGTIGELVNNSAIADNVQNATTHLKTASLNSEKAIAEIDEFLSGLKKQGALVHELVTDTTVFLSLKEAITQFKEASASISDFAENLDQAGTALGKTDNPAGTMLNDKQVAADLKEITRNLNESSKKLDEDLEAMQHSFLLKGYFKKQQKQAKKAEDQKQEN
jgi:phospholipid/cholesterol/gamma-HCH transport system substrate-binding protein